MPGLLLFRLPKLQRILERLLDGADFHAGAGKLGRVHDTIGTRCLRSQAIEFLVAGPEFELPVRLENALDGGDNFARGDKAGIGDIVNSEGRAPPPEIEA